jgi:hypothetical protein
MVNNVETIAPPDVFHLNAAFGWLELGNPSEAAADLERISPAHQNHPDVLEVRWQIRARLEQWESCLAIATSMCIHAPERPQGWLHLSVSLYRMKRTQEAWDALLPMAEKFPKSWVIPYDLSCYACQLSQTEQGRHWLRKAFALASSCDVKAIAMADPDLETLWPEIRTGKFDPA